MEQNNSQITEPVTGMETVLEGFNELAEELGMDEEIKVDLLQSFVERCRGFLEILETTVDGQEADMFERTTHSLKGLAGNMRFVKLGGLNENFTQAVQAGDKEQATLFLREMWEEFQQIKEAIAPLTQ